MKRHITTYILATTLFLGEIHTFWEKQNPPRVENWIWRKYTPMTVQWNVKQAVDELNCILYFVAMLLYRKNKVNATTVKTLIFFAILDALLYFYDYKTYSFGPVYFWVATVWILMYFWRPATNYIWRKIHT